MTLNTDGDIGRRASGPMALGGENEALDVRLDPESSLSATSTGGVINFHTPDSVMKVGQITAHSGVILHSNSSIEGGVVEVSDPGSHLGLVLDADEGIDLTSNSSLSHSGSGAIHLRSSMGSIMMADGSVVSNTSGVIHLTAAKNISLSSLQTGNGGMDAVVVTTGAEIEDGGEGDRDIIITSTSGQAVLNAEMGIGVLDPLELDVPALVINNTSGDVNIVNVRDVVLGGLSQGGGTGTVHLVSNGGLTLADGIMVMSNGTQVEIEGLRSDFRNECHV